MDRPRMPLERWFEIMEQTPRSIDQRPSLKQKIRTRSFAFTVEINILEDTESVVKDVRVVFHAAFMSTPGAIQSTPMAWHIIRADIEDKVFPLSYKIGPIIRFNIEQSKQFHPFLIAMGYPKLLECLLEIKGKCPAMSPA